MIIVIIWNRMLSDNFNLNLYFLLQSNSMKKLLENSQSILQITHKKLGSLKNSGKNFFYRDNKYEFIKNLVQLYL